MIERLLFRARDLAAPSLILLAIWALTILVVNPVGEFFVNDDWSFVKIVEEIWSNGSMPATGWGKGGPSAIVHILWGGLFRYLGGPSLTVLRISVLALSIIASLGLLILLRLAGASRWLSLCGALTLMANPLFISQSFTFMTDITFCAILIYAVMLLFLAVDRGSIVLAGFGLFFSLLAILTRQVGIVIPLGFVVTCFLHPKGKALGGSRVALLALAIAIVPWLGYEYFLASVGSTPVTRHEVIHNILELPRVYGAWGYTVRLLRQFFLVALGYTCFFVSPMLALSYPDVFAKTPVKLVLVIITFAIGLLEAGILLGFINPPMLFHYNVIFNMGIGPILLKDTYILGIPRTEAMTPALFYVIAYWSGVAQVVFWSLCILWLGKLLRNRYEGKQDSTSFLAAFALFVAGLYLAIILLTAFHDRYLIPLVALGIIWLAADLVVRGQQVQMGGKVAAAFAILAIGVPTVPAVHDFMELKRAQVRATEYLVRDLGIDPCAFDGGFEHNGYHCYRRGITSAEGASWWWVAEEKYVVALGPLPGYCSIKTIPFDRYLGKDGAIHVLAPQDSPGLSRSARQPQR